ncbi:lipase [Nocardia tenerifensis]|uniref:Lipase n=1 Tax=Nocardia tenerifensis TaxID=228006 RepID=A0A318K6U5_9NOCA|nr:alpha/beta fold hydrolase [Nocardia tenerifensis]PXX69058.1 lipase [Nocardia tenerifensis]
MSALHVYRFGPANGQAVLALHGMTGHGKRWEDLAVNHLPDLRIIAPDLRGHGRSSALPPWTFEAVADDLVELLEAETTEPVTVVGHSFGGACAMYLARRRPDLIRGLVLLDPAIGLAPEFVGDIAESLLAEPDFESVARAREDKLASAWADVAPNLLEAELDEHLVPTPQGRFAWRMSIPAITSYWGQLARPFVLPPRDLPTVLVQALKVQPPFVTPEFRAALTEHLGARLTVHDWDSDHMLPQALPAETAALIRSAL